MKKYILSGDHKQLINYHSFGREFSLAVPISEHFLPLLYVLTLQDKNEEVSFFNDTAIGGSITMTSIKIDW
jgi:4,5-DOPA dioxygenase extradiol